MAQLLQAVGISCVDLAPGKYFPDPATTTDRQIAVVRGRWESWGFAVAGMQSLLFGTSGLNLFDETNSRMLERLGQIAHVGAGLGAPSMTFGSPHQRVRGELDDRGAHAVALDFFYRLGDVAAAAGIIVCIEPNPAAYGCDFLVGTEEAATFVRALGHRAVRLQLDVGAMKMNEEPPGVTIAATAAVIGHVHASEPGLVQLGEAEAPHEEAAAALRDIRPDLTVTVEMKPSTLEPHAAAVLRAATLAVQLYGDTSR